MLLAFHKPYAVLSQFTPDKGENRTLAEFGFPKDVYAIGRLDADSEGLLLLSDEPQWNARILSPKNELWKTYWAQVEGTPSSESLTQLREGVIIEGKKTLPARASILEPQPTIVPRNPPIRVRKSIPDTWIELQIHEGRNRQVRKMTAAMGHPTLRLIRRAIGEINLGDLASGTWRELSREESQSL
ncbi:MAG: pseudouridine synthase [Chthoniobacterales bacterium]